MDEADTPSEGDGGMRGILRFAIVTSALSVLLASNAARAEWVKVEPPDGGFSMFFPGTPTAKTSKKPESVTHIWSARVGKIVCSIGVTDYNGRLDAEQELQLDMENFLKQIQATATSQQKLSFRDAPDGPLPALRFSFTRSGWTGQSLVVVAGDRSYQVAALAETGSDTKDLARCIAFKVTAKSRYYQPP